MASVTLAEFYIHDAADLSDHVMSHGFGSASYTDVGAGEVRTYAGGRRRVIRRKGRGQTYELTMPAVSSTVIGWLEEHIGSTVLIRDPRGRKVWGVYFSTDMDYKPGPVAPDVSLTIQSVTASEAV